jgi:uncharacterized protein (DUF2336 family)
VASSLSQADVDRLLSDSSAQTRADVAGRIGRDLDSPALTAVEVRTAQDIVRLMARDVEVSVRAALSKNLRRAARLPHDVALQLARDVEAVALPILTDSLVLTDEDLLDVVRRGSAAKQTAIAGRPEVSEPVSAALVTSGDETTVSTLMRNPGARVSEQSLTQAIDRFPDSDAVKEGIVHRDVLPSTVTERLVAMVSDRLREYLVVKHRLSPALATEIVLQTRERATLDLSNGLGAERLAELVGQIYRSGRLTPTLVLRALCIGDMAFFEAAIAAMAAVPVENARILIHDGGRKGFAAIYGKSGLSPDLFPAFRAATDVIDSTGFDGEARDVERFRSRVIARILTQFDDFDQDDLDYLVARLEDVLVPA